MIRIKELYRLQNLKRLRLIAGQEGLDRTVTAAVLLEYDPSRMQLPDFYRGDLVVTTLAYAIGDDQLVSNSLLALMRQGIAGLLVKTAYFSELPQAVVNMANQLGTPLFLFDETYIEEVILEVTELIRGKRHFSGYEKELDALLSGSLSLEKTKECVQRIDPVGSKAYWLCALYPREGVAVISDKLYVLLSSDEKWMQRCVCMEWRGMLMLLLRSAEEEETNVKQTVRTLLDCAGIGEEEAIVGISDLRKEQATFGMALGEAMYAARTAKVLAEPMRLASDMGLYAYLFPMSENPFVCEQCRKTLARIREYDQQNRTNLEQTAIVYVKERMEIAAAAKALFQHPNTVRYRLTKIQKLMELNDDALFAPMLSLTIHLSRILEEEGRG